MWLLEYIRKIPATKKPILIEGLPGVGNVGKIAADFIIEELDILPCVNFFSPSLPHSVFVNEKNLVELPKIEMYVSTKKNILLLTGDLQPADEVSCYEFCEKILDLIQEQKVKHIITLGGIALREEPIAPEVYITGNSKALVNKYKKHNGLNAKVYGKVGPILGVSGLLLGLAGKRRIGAVTLLAETLGHPMYLGLKGAREILRALNSALNLALDLEALDEEIKGMEHSQDIEADVLIASKYSRKIQKYKNMSYIG